MKTPSLAALFLALSLAVSAAAPADGPIRVLFLGHESKHHNSGEYVPILMKEFGREAIYFDYFTKPDCLNADTLSHYDALMLYANHGNITPEQLAALKDFIESGHGFLPIHSASACFGNSPEFIAMVGGRFKSHGGGVFKATIVDKTHPIMEGVNEYETWDETYVHDQLNATGRKLLAERVEGEHKEPWTWVREQGKGRVFYTASGHDDKTWKNPDFQKMLRNAIVWSVGDAVKARWEAFLAQREPEKREKSPHVANYENRPEPLTFQHPMTVKGSMERTQVPADMTLQLFASEPEIRKPIAFAWDERGRLWVCETSDYPHGVKPDGVGSDTVRICEDTNGDGKADKFTVFADKLNLPTGLVFANGGIIVSQPPRFLFLKDTDGDDKADVREEIMTGWGIGDTHAQASSLHYGYDNWLYGCVGYSGFNGKVGDAEKRFGMGTYRFKADGSALEFLHQFTNNSWAHGMNAAGDQFGGTANGAPIFHGGIPATILPPGTKGMTAKRINIVGAAHTITPNFRQVDVMGGYTAAAGSAFAYSANLPPRMQGTSLVTEPTMKLVALMDVRPSGAGYVAHDGFNILASSDEWLSPVFAEVGPDGAVWIADFQNFIIQHNPTPSVGRGGYDAKTGPGGAHENPLRDHERGRIYRVVWKNAKAPAITSLKGASPEDLVKALGNDNQFWRLKAQQMLVEGKAVAAADSLKEIVMAKDSTIAAIHALWTLHGLGQLDETTHRSALSAKSPELRRNAIRALDTDAKAQALLFGSGTISDADLITRLAAYVKLAQLPTTPELTTLASRLGTDPDVAKDEWLKEAVRILGLKHGVPEAGAADAPVAAGDAKRGEDIYWKHPTAACALCHALAGKGSTVGPALDGIATRKEAAYIKESLIEPGRTLAQGYEALGASPMPPMGLILKPQELADIEAFLQTLK